MEWNNGNETHYRSRDPDSLEYKPSHVVAHFHFSFLKFSTIFKIVSLVGLYGEVCYQVLLNTKL